MGHHSDHQMGCGQHHLPPGAARFYPETRQFPPDTPHAHVAGYGEAICTDCQAIWRHKRWQLDAIGASRLAGHPRVRRLRCPACTQIARHEYDGEVFLEGPLVSKDHGAILGLLRNTEWRLRQNNPLARLARIERTGDRLRILTITPFLAERIGKEMQKAYDGTLRITHAQRERFTRVFWSRDEDGDVR
ncbi:MAG: hypothetical protein VKP62_14735 [Candidatus Sericytochromatia bacterium]|nr:hypothetical protein [Candidatus Sericytochromatia bacterium]